MSRWQEAAAHFERALTMNTSMSTRPWVAHAQHDYAAMLLMQGEAGPRKRAQQLIGEAVSSYHELGMRTWADKAGELKRMTSQGPRG
jgi:uncharacterized protein HemY